MGEKIEKVEEIEWPKEEKHWKALKSIEKLWPIVRKLAFCVKYYNNNDQTKVPRLRARNDKGKEWWNVKE